MSPRAVRLVDQALEVVGAAVGRIGGERHDAVVAPVARAGELRKRHQLDRGHAELGQMIELAPHAIERAFLGERADVQLVQHGFCPRAGRATRCAARRSARGSTTTLGPCTSSGCQREAGSGTRKPSSSWKR